jgi:hypothetical protein
MTAREAALRTAADKAPSAPPAHAPASCAGGSGGCVVCGALRRYRRQLCRRCWSRFNAQGLEMPPPESRAGRIEDYLGRVLAALPRPSLARVISVALTSNEVDR